MISGFGVLVSGFAQAGYYHHHAERTFSVAITNITKGVSFTPFLVASHDYSLDLFSLGKPSSEELAIIAEGGNTSPLNNVLTASNNVYARNGSSGLMMPEQSVIVEVQTTRRVAAD